ncbi:hypothetical protein GTQ40_10595 [Flavobacteriaceae bacterium R38]|nr:hypothetical protein [Flavobacteriaceae bacterium R38]
MIKKEIFIGFLVGIIANAIGFIISIFILANYSNLTFNTSLKVVYEQGNLGSLIALGAALNIAAFFLFLKLRRDHRAKGVLMATVLAAIFILFYKFFL